jgi:hypothetical protein
LIVSMLCTLTAQCTTVSTSFRLPAPFPFLTR